MLLDESTLEINLTTGAMTASDVIAARTSLSLKLTGTQSLVNSNIKAALYRFDPNTSSGTLVATCDSFTGGQDDFVGTMDLNTQQVVDAFEALEALRQNELATFYVLVYDATQNTYIIFDTIDLSWEFPLVAGTPGSVSPISVGTDTLGDLKLHNGSLYKHSATDGLWYQWTVVGAGATIHEHLDETGIVL